jgi:hypothetical protein
LFEVCASLLNLSLEDRRIELGNNLALLHSGIKVGVKGLDRARDLRPDLNGGNGLKRSGGADGVSDVAPFDFGGH